MRSTKLVFRYEKWAKIQPITSDRMVEIGAVDFLFENCRPVQWNSQKNRSVKSLFSEVFLINFSLIGPIRQNASSVSIKIQLKQRNVRSLKAIGGTEHHVTTHRIGRLCVP
jgi:hypothetical protein